MEGDEETSLGASESEASSSQESATCCCCLRECAGEGFEDGEERERRLRDEDMSTMLLVRGVKGVYKMFSSAPCVDWRGMLIVYV